MGIFAFMKTTQQIEYERRVYKLQAYNRMKVANDLKKQRKTVEVDEYYDNKLLKAWRRYEKRYDATTKRMIAQQQIAEMQKESKEQTMTKKQQDKIQQNIAKAKEKLAKRKVKDKTRTKSQIEQLAYKIVQLYARIYWSDEK